MDVSVVIPWRPGCPYRQAALDWVTARYENEGFQVVLGYHLEGEWRKAVAVADGVARCDGDVLIVADADVWCDGVPSAVGNVGTGWAVPHDKVHRLTHTTTEGVLAGGELAGQLEQPPYTGYPGGGIVVLARASYEACPLDPRFAGWGQEDASWAVALSAMFGWPWRGEAALYHLWHPPQDRKNRREGNRNGMRLARRYGNTQTRRDMEALIGEAKQWTQPA